MYVLKNMCIFLCLNVYMYVSVSYIHREGVIERVCDRVIVLVYVCIKLYMYICMLECIHV